MVIPFSFIYDGSHEVTFHFEDSFNSMGGILKVFVNTLKASLTEGQCF